MDGRLPVIGLGANFDVDTLELRDLCKITASTSSYWLHPEPRIGPFPLTKAFESRWGSYGTREHAVLLPRSNCISRHVVLHPCIRLTALCGAVMIFGQQPPLVINSQLASRIHRSVPSSSERSVIMRITEATNEEVTNEDQVVKENIQIVVRLQPQTHTQVETAYRKPISN